MISPDVALELGWINGYHNFVVPFLIQTFKRTHDRLKALELKTTPSAENKTEDEVASSYANGNLNGFGNNMLMLGNGGDMSGMAPPPQMGGNGIDMTGFGVPNGVPNMPPQMGMGM